MILRVIICAALLSGGAWLLFYAERIQVRVNVYHEGLKRSRRASRLFLKVTSRNYELATRFLGATLILLFLVLAVLTAIEFEHYREVSGAGRWGPPGPLASARATPAAGDLWRGR